MVESARANHGYTLEDGENVSMYVIFTLSVHAECHCCGQMMCLINVGYSVIQCLSLALKDLIGDEDSELVKTAYVLLLGVH